MSTIRVVPSLLKDPATQIDPLGLSPVPEDTRQRFLRFKLLEENSSLLPLQNIAEVRPLTAAEILPVPDLQGSILGVCNWRSEILWLVDFNALVGALPLWTQVPLLEDPIAIVVQSAHRSIGLVVEQMGDIELIAPESILLESDLCASTLAPYVAGYLPDHGGMILNTDAIVNSLFQDTP